MGYLAEVDYLMLTDDIDWDDIYNRSINGYTIKDLNQRLYARERFIDGGRNSEYYKSHK